MSLPTFDLRIVCAAIFYPGEDIVVLGVRHYDRHMQEQIARFGLIGKATIQGFVDNNGRFWNRMQSWDIAKEAQQIARSVSGETINGGLLYSEHLY